MLAKLLFTGQDLPHDGVLQGSQELADSSRIMTWTHVYNTR